MAMGLLDILSQYQQQPNRPPPQVFDDFDLVAREAPAEELEYGLEEVFNSDDTPPAEELIGQLYEHSDDDTRAELLNEIRRHSSINFHVSAPSNRRIRTEATSDGSKLQRFTPCLAPGSGGSGSQ
jgi:hypothetical protein